ncbi:MAG: tetratricopeptide repeat-containing glycosyltransferase family protein [Tepidisphaeraceae bacterium]
MTLQQRLEVGLAHHRAGRLHEAEDIYRQILAEQPDYADALHLLGSLAAQIGHHDAAIDLLKKAIQLNPNFAAYHGNLGAVYMKLSRLDEAEAALQRALQLDPSLPDAYYNLGGTLTEKGDFDRALSTLHRGLALHPNWPQMYNSIGVTLRICAKYDEAIASYRRAVSIQPDYAEGHWNLGLTLLLVGDFAAGWTQYEWRKKMPDVVRPRNFTPPEWTGEKLDGKTILLHAEQGFGDTLQFIRYVPLVVERGGRVIVECPPELATVLRGVEGIQEIFVQGQTLPSFDTHRSIMSLPLTFGATAQTIPAKVPYLAVPADRIAAWRQRLGDAPLGVGLVWAGGPQYSDDSRRSMRLEHFAPLAAVKSARFHLLQKGPAASQAATPPPGMDLVNWAADLHDFVETAALITNLDLVISVDTSVAHLAGALGKPVWVLLPFVPDWRWMLNRDDSPWYPTMRLFRQPAAGDWATPIAQVVQALHRRAADRLSS